MASCMRYYVANSFKACLTNSVTEHFLRNLKVAVPLPNLVDFVNQIKLGCKESQEIAYCPWESLIEYHSLMWNIATRWLQ